MNMMEIVNGQPRDKSGLSSAKLILSGIRAGMWALSAASPGLAAHVAERLWFTPPRPRVPEPARAVLRQGQPLGLKVRARNIASWRWGEGPPVLLIHGWGGYAGQMTKFVAPLVEAGFSVIALDAPGHGASDESWLGYRQASLLDFAEAIRVAAATVGSLHGLVAHSGGCTAAAIALNSDIQVAGAVFCAPMARPAEFTKLYGEVLGLDPSVTQRWKSNAEARIGFRWEEVDMTRAARVAGVPPALVIHDRDDREIPCSEGALLVEAWPRSELHSTEGLGHRKLLRDPEVVARATRFLRRVSSLSS